MGTIYCVIGKSSTGKDSIYKRLLQREDLQLKKIVPYTTRPIREKEVEGVEYHFVTEEKRLELEAAGKIIEGRSYDTIYGRWDYFTVDDGQIDLAGGDYLLNPRDLREAEGILQKRANCADIYRSRRWRTLRAGLAQRTEAAGAEVRRDVSSVPSGQQGFFQKEAGRIRRNQGV